MMWWSCSIWNPLCPPSPTFFFLRKHFYDDLDESWFLSVNVGSSPSNCSYLLDNIHCTNPSSDWGGGVGGVVQSSYILKIKSLWKTNKCSLVKKKEARILEWVTVPFSPSPGNLPYPVIEPGSPALQVDSLPAELPRNP